MKGKKVSLIRFLLLGCIVLSGIVVFSKDSLAIPAFMRKYRTACTTCHWATFPKLNAFGRQFRNNGYRIPVGDEAFVKDEPVVLGAKPWKKLFPNAVWPGDTPGLPPIGLELKSDFIWRIDQRSPGFDIDQGFPTTNPIAKLGNKVDTDFNGIKELKLNTGGTFGDTISFFGVFTLLEDNQSANSITGFAGIERAFLVYSPYIKGEQGLVNFRVGQFEPRAVAFSFHRDINRIAFPLINASALFESGNLHAMSPNQRGIELFGAKDGPGGKGGLEWAIGLVNGDLGPVTEQVLRRGGYVEDSPMWKLVSKEHDTFDFNSEKDFYARLSWKFGGMGVLGHEEETEELKLTKNWQDNSIKIGVTYYQGVTGAFYPNRMVGANIGNALGRGAAGRTELTGAFPVTGDLSIDRDNNHFKRFGADVDAFWGDFNFKGQFMFFEDKVRNGILEVADLGGNPAPDAVIRRGGQRFKWRNTLLAVEWVAKPWLIPALRYQRIDFIESPPVLGGPSSRMDSPSSTNQADAIVANRGRADHLQNIAFDLTVLLRPNMKMLIGYTATEKPPRARSGVLTSGGGFFGTPGIISDQFRIGLDFSL